MFKSLYGKLSLVLLVLFFAIGVAFITISIVSTEKYQQEINQKLNRKLAELIVAETVILQDGRINDSALKEIFHMLMVINPSIEVYLLDPDGTILSFSAEPGKVKRKRVDLGPVNALLRGSEALPLLGDDPRDRKGKKVFTAAPIFTGGHHEGYLYIILGGETYDSIIDKIQGSYILQLSIRVILMGLLLALITGLLIFAFMTRRLKRLADVMDGYESGSALDTLDLLPLKGHGPRDEIDKLITTFRKMTDRIQSQMQKLERSDTMRRELVANVSHDLRTPLATLRGYMETLLMKDNSLSPEERRHYLAIAVSHCERLGNLITDLFELATLDARDRAVHCESFSVSELVQDVVQKFALSAQEKQINIETNVGKDLPFAFADIALIERVLENLLENAIRHTPQSGSVAIALSSHSSSSITVQVRDTGKGIPEREIPRIFDRFYQLDSSRKGKPSHSGLGLAIARRILELHNSTINVESQQGRGSTFTFRLPASSS